MHRKRILLIAVSLLLMALVGDLGRQAYALAQQDRLNHALIVAIKQNSTKKALALLAAGADPNSRDEPPKHRSLWWLLLKKLSGKRLTASDAHTALLLACSSNDEMGTDYPDNPVLVKALLDRGADLEAKDTTQRTPLFRAAARNKTQVCTLLLDRGARVNVADTRGLTPLMIAARNNNRVLVRQLLNNGSDVSAVGYTLLGCCLTPLIEAQWAQEDDPTITEMLLESGANVNGPDAPLA